ncbi:hypothetical protein Tco_1168725, partial [Tanacetum coccineum]
NYINDALTFVKPHTISDASFQKPLASEVALTSHMLKVAKLFQEPEQSLILSSKKVNADDGTNKTLSRTTVQPITQLKAPTNKKPQKKRIPSSSKPKSSYKVKVILLKKQVTKTQHAEETVAIVDATQSLEDSESVEDQVNQPHTAEAEKTNDANITFMGFGPINMELDDTGFDIHSMPNDDLASLTGFETLDLVDKESNSVTKEHSADNLNVTSDGDIALPNASAGFSALSDPLVIFEES